MTFSFQASGHRRDAEATRKGWGMTTETLTLKWGTVKGWSDLSDESMGFLRQYFAGGVPMSAAADHPDQDRKKILCQLIDQMNGEIWLDWEGKRVSKEEAKKYVLEYGPR
jgi:hypothetical protein